MGHDPVAPPDSEVIESSFRHPQAFAALFTRHSEAVYRYLVRRVGVQDAQDLLGETFATAFHIRSHYDLGRRDARPWFFGIATNLVRHHWRAEARRRGRDVTSAVTAVSEDDIDDTTSRLFFSAQEHVLGSALGHLDAGHLDVLLLVAGAGLSYEDVSVALGIPVGTVKSRLSRSRQQLRELLGDSWQYIEGEPPTGQTATVTEGTS